LAYHETTRQNGSRMNTTKQYTYGQKVPNMQTQPMQQMQPMGQMPITSGMMPPPDTLRNPYYTAGFLRQFIGSNMRVEYLLGTNGPLVDRVGELVDVGANYIVLKPYLSDDLLMTDLYSIRFVTIYDQL